MVLLRLARIGAVGLRFGLHELLPSLAANRLLGALARMRGEPLAVRLRRALEALGPIFVKFGQMLSTRRDLLPADFADELAKLQDRVPPFPGALAQAEIERALGRPVAELFAEFQADAEASASIAQVHLARLPGGEEVAVKVLRPGVERAVARDLALLRAAARAAERLSADARRLRLRAVVEEFARHLDDELDLVREAANASQLGRNFEGSPLLAVPRVHWELCTPRVMVMERMRGIPVSQVERLRAAGVDIRALARAGVEIFFTQVFRDGFFHADMHPGNILVEVAREERGAVRARYIALDFGIMGTLGERDQQWLARNFLAFFRRDYRQVAEAHVEAGWAPAGTRLDAFEAAIRAVCEPVFARPLREIYFGRLLLRLFQAMRRFDIEVQPQLVMLQKTLLAIEGLGRELDPELDLWETAKPYLERWMRERSGVRALARALAREAPYWAAALPALPRLAHRLLAEERIAGLQRALESLARENARRNEILRALVAAVLALALLAALLAFAAAPG